MHFVGLLFSILIFQELGEFSLKFSAPKSVIKCSISSRFQLIRNILKYLSAISQCILFNLKCKYIDFKILEVVIKLRFCISCISQNDFKKDKGLDFKWNYEMFYEIFFYKACIFYNS